MRKNTAFSARDSNGTYSTIRPATADDIIYQARHILNRRFRKGRTIGSPSDTREFLELRLGGKEHEVFCCLFLSNRHQIIEFVELFKGTIDGCAVYPREVVKAALSRNAAAIILAHNHPSGIPEPSESDKVITRRVRSALELVDIRLLDHFVIGGGETVSLATRGML